MKTPISLSLINVIRIIWSKVTEDSKRLCLDINYRYTVKVMRHTIVFWLTYVCLYQYITVTTSFKGGHFTGQHFNFIFWPWFRLNHHRTVVRTRPISFKAHWKKSLWLYIFSSWGQLRYQAYKNWMQQKHFSTEFFLDLNFELVWTKKTILLFNETNRMKNRKVNIYWR